MTAVEVSREVVKEHGLISIRGLFIDRPAPGPTLLSFAVQRLPRVECCITSLLPPWCVFHGGLFHGRVGDRQFLNSPPAV